MILLKGHGIFDETAMGKLQFFQRSDKTVLRYHVEDTAKELQRLNQAKRQAGAELALLYQENLPKIGESNAMIFQIHQMLLEDLDYTEAIVNIITAQNLNAEYAVSAVSESFSHIFAQMEDEYMKERAADVKDVSDRLINVLSGRKENKNILTEPVIIAANDLSPSETVQLNKEFVLGFVTKNGSPNSHTAILARTMNIPAVIAVGEALSEDLNGSTVILDGKSGQLIIDPSEEQTAQYLQIQKNDREKQVLLQSFRERESITLDGQCLNICANIGSVSDLDTALQNGADGIGLFRSEFVYLQSDRYPTEEEQFDIYRNAVTKMNGKTITFRTLDIGSDKQIHYFDLPRETNPALGYRAIRICLNRQDIFRTQLRALYRASAYGKIAIMFPMIISTDEIRQIKQIISSVKADLDAKGLPYDKTAKIGIMIETPAAALLSDILADEVDFFSIGTNDLTQYTLALDRQNNQLSSYYNPRHPAVLRLIELTVQHAHKNGIPVGICGELAADLTMTETFLAMGIDELSVPPSCILSLRQKVCTTDVSNLAMY